MTAVLRADVDRSTVSLARAALAGLLWLACLPGAALAEPVYAFDATPGRLPKTVVPRSYAIELTPDAKDLSVAGREDIEIDVREPTARLVLNAVDLTLSEATVDETRRAEIRPDPATETVTLSLREPLSVGQHRLHIVFAGKINPFPRGLYYADYPTSQGTKRMISSHLEPADARRVFPCWDEPAFKAAFTLTATVAPNFMAVGNMPVVREEVVSTTQKRVSFAPTPKMSSYLFVFTTGELERIGVNTAGVSVGLITTQGKSEQGRFALASAVDLLAFYNEYFGVAYPLPKLDLIAVPGGFGGAMENWGGITFFESRLLFDPATMPDSARRGIFGILAHEMAHQWFGDLVTMGWWDNLWLNEGFASWMQERAAEHLHPDWKNWLNGYSQKQSAMALDARRTSHPVQQKIEDESEALTAFDGITYNKGQSLIRMLETYLGDDAFREGLRSYMASHAYANATTADLWKALQDATGKPVAAIAGSFTEQDGVPLVIAETHCVENIQRLTLQQDRFALLPLRSTIGSTAQAGLPARRWLLPLKLGLVGGRDAEILLLDGATEIAAGRCGRAIEVNLGDIGYYRVEYGPNDRAALVKSFAALTPEDRVGLLADSWALVQAGRADVPSYMGLIGKIALDDQRVVWDQVIGVLGHLNRLARDRSERQALQAFARTSLRPVFDRLGWDGGAGDTDSTLLRASLIRALGDFGDADIIAEARRRFDRFRQDPNSLAAELRDPLMHVVGITADKPTYEALLSLARKATATNERLRYYFAAASARDPTLSRETLALTLTDELPNTIIGGVISTVAFAGEQPELAWDFVQKHYDALATKLGPSFRDSFIPNLMTSFSDGTHAAELLQFAPAQATSGGKVMTARAVETIALAADLKARALPAVEAWIREPAGARPRAD